MSEIDRDRARGLIPLTPATFHILVALGEGPQHGYGIMRDVEALTDGAFRVGPGTLYRSLEAMVADGLIEEHDPRGAVDERRRVYALTRLGTETARAEARRLEQLVKIAQRRGLLTAGREVRRRPERSR